MFAGIQGRIGDIFTRLKRRGFLRESDVDAALEELRVALLDADVALEVVKSLVSATRAHAVGTEVLHSLSPAQQVLKVLYEEMTRVLGGTNQTLALRGNPPIVFFLAGLQGSGKTTTAAKLAWRFVTKQRKRVLLASLDTSRPAAFAQLSQLASRFAADVLERTPGEPSRAIARRARQVATLEGHDVLLLDTAGLQTTSSSQLRLLAEVRDVASPAETLLVADAMSGQASAGTARAFHEELGIGGVILTRMDGDQQGGAALSMHSVAGCGIRGVGTGEGLEDLEDFHPDRTALRILGLGGRSEFLARLGDDSDESAGAGVAQELSHGRFDLNDFAVQLKRMRKMGGVGKMLEMLPGLSRGRRGGLHAPPDERFIVRQLAAIDSMTPLERCRPSVIKSSRKLRIARGAGVDVVEINRLLKQHKQMQTLTKRFSKRGRQRGPGFPARGSDFPTGFSGRLRGG